MKKKSNAKIVMFLLGLCCIYTHRKVIQALLKQEPMPKAPKWHCWVKEENRRK